MNIKPNLSAPDDAIGVLLARYVAGEATRDDCDRIHAWAEGDEANARTLAELERVWVVSAEPAHQQWDVDQALRAVEAKATVAKHSPRRVAAPSRFVSSRSGVGRIFAAAAFAATVVFGTTWYVSRSSHVATPVREQVYVTRTGERALYTLADGSQVTLAPKTTLRLVSGFSDASRTVILNGEAHFSVNASASAPFVVQTGAITTRVLGTGFVVSHYDAENVRVTVATGKVSVSGLSGKLAVVPAGAMARATDSSITVSPARNLDADTAWLHNRIRFDRTPVPEALATLSRWYDVEFRLGDSTLVTRDLTGGLMVGSLSEMLTTLKTLLNVSLTYERNSAGITRVTLTPNQTGTPYGTPRHRRYDTFSPLSTLGR